ncbi:hypothetical protein [Actinomadura sp. 9N407]|uniref:hypothetical protein n=1 Tax=Actinomadura sp. 9N407 TaxID=3375154 RepID=UPI0037A432D0
MDPDDARAAFTCSFCAGTIPEASPELRRLTVSRLDGFPSQELFVHRTCLIRTMSSDIPRGEVFE